MSLSFSFQWFRRTGRIFPCDCPAKKASVVREIESKPPVKLLISPVCKLISGKGASFSGLKYSDTLALHNTLMELKNSFFTYHVALCPCKQYN